MRTWIEIDAQALTYNIHMLKRVSGSAQLALVVKSNAYGHGMLSIAHIVEDIPVVSLLCTAGLQEALLLRSQGIKKPILVLSYIDAPHEQAILHNIQCAIYNYADAVTLNTAAQKHGVYAHIHLKIDTGMTRLGVLPQDTLALVKKILVLPNLILQAVFTHLCDTPNPDPSFSAFQLQQFDQVVALLEQQGIVIPYTHTLSSSGLRLTTKKNYSLVRAGARAYGLWKLPECKQALQERHGQDFDLQTVMTWKTRIIHINTVPAGSSVGYDRTHIVPKESRIAILPIGYWDGYPRSLSNRGVVLVNDTYAPVVGIVSMNLTAIDITDCPITISVGDEVTLIGPQEYITPMACAQKAQSITNEIVTRIHSDIPRIITNKENN